jgi:hypothetical protein
MLALAGAAGAALMFIADLVLYLPSRRDQLTAAHYFKCIDPNGDALHSSSMAEIDDARLMLGGALGPIASVLYTAGYFNLYGRLRPEQGALLPAAACVGLSTMMVVGGCYHALFVFTGFIAKAFSEGNRAANATLGRLLGRHRAYIWQVYRWAAAPALLGSSALALCILTRETACPRWSALLVPALSAPLKLLLRRRSAGGLVLCGGLTNLWNLAMFLATG